MGWNERGVGSWAAEEKERFRGRTKTTLPHTNQLGITELGSSCHAHSSISHDVDDTTGKKLAGSLTQNDGMSAEHFLYECVCVYESVCVCVIVGKNAGLE